MDQFTAFSLIICCSSFTKIIVTLTLLRFALGLQSAAFGIVIIFFSLALGWLSIESNPTLRAAWSSAADGAQTWAELEKGLTIALSAKVQPESVASLDRNKESDNVDNKTPEQGSFALLLSSFLLAELKAGLLLGLILLLPFIAIDLLLANIFALLNFNTSSLDLISLSLKLGLFLVIDGWDKIVAKLLG
ncbi:MAG TPA: hypothetical protein PKD37_01485 [Oligoflexia bacterium]|nr:hypothetical protein [Oligoflexia bacterium]HMP26648.1 hypothetical protein [Oligoflexia bacterium]